MISQISPDERKALLSQVIMVDQVPLPISEGLYFIDALKSSVINWGQRDEASSALIQDIQYFLKQISFKALAIEAMEHPHILVPCLRAMNELQLRVVIPLLSPDKFEEAIASFPIDKQMECLMAALPSQKKAYFSQVLSCPPVFIQWLTHPARLEPEEPWEDFIHIAQQMTITHAQMKSVLKRLEKILMIDEVEHDQRVSERVKKMNETMEIAMKEIADIRIKIKESVNLTKETDDLCCPITSEIMTDPVKDPTNLNMTYDRTSLERLAVNGVVISPTTRRSFLLSEVIPNEELAKKIQSLKT